MVFHHDLSSERSFISISEGAIVGACWRGIGSDVDSLNARSYQYERALREFRSDPSPVIKPLRIDPFDLEFGGQAPANASIVFAETIFVALGEVRNDNQNIGSKRQRRLLQGY
jgi:hypothetical protein